MGRHGGPFRAKFPLAAAPPNAVAILGSVFLSRQSRVDVRAKQGRRQLDVTGRSSSG